MASKAEQTRRRRQRQDAEEHRRRGRVAGAARLYGKTQRRTSKFMVHDENNEAKVGDTVAIVETRPLSRRKRWA